MWRDDYRLIRETICANRLIIKLLMERAELITRVNIAERPNEKHNVANWQGILRAYPQKLAQLLRTIDDMPMPTDAPSEEQIEVLQSLSNGGKLEIAINLPVVVTISNPAGAHRCDTIGMMARRLLQEMGLLQEPSLP